MPDSDAFRRLLMPAAIVLLIACWLGGGVTADDTAIDEWLLLLALPVLALAAATLASEWPRARILRCGVAVALLVALLPALQLLPLPMAWWSLPAGRESMAADLSQAAKTSSGDCPARAGPGSRSASIRSPWTRTAVA